MKQCRSHRALEVHNSMLDKGLNYCEHGLNPSLFPKICQFFEPIFVVYRKSKEHIFLKPGRIGIVKGRTKVLNTTIVKIT